MDLGLEIEEANFLANSLAKLGVDRTELFYTL